MTAAVKSLTPAFPGMSLRRTPLGMDKVAMPADQVAVMQKIALEVFTDMSNSGFSLRDTVAAIYLTGAQHAISVLKSDTKDK